MCTPAIEPEQWAASPWLGDAVVLLRLPPAQLKANCGQYHELPEVNGYFDDAQHYTDVK
jgi:hypothetical protein